MAVVPFAGRDMAVIDLFDRLSDPLFVLEHFPPEKYETRVDWLETPEAHVFKADLPGLKKDEIKVQVDDRRTLQISGERKNGDVQKTDKWRRRERVEGSFRRTLHLPEDLKLDEMKARVGDGVLTITIPKQYKHKPEVRSIEITV